MPKTAPLPVQDWTFDAIGTKWWLGVYDPVAASHWRAVQRTVTARIDTFDATYSRFRADSLVAQVAQAAGSYDFPADSTRLFALYHRLYDATDGLLTPLIGQMLADAGYDANYSLRSKRLVQPPAWDEALALHGTRLVTSQPVLLDFGAAGKGYLVDLISTLLQEQGVTRFCIDASGDLYAHGLDEPLQIGLEHPDDPNQVIGVAALQTNALCGSATNRRQWGQYHHILNPSTLQPANAVKAVWVSAPSAALADGLATALFFVPPERLAKHFRFAYCLVNSHNEVRYSASFPGELFT